MWRRWGCVMQNSYSDCANAAVATILLHYKKEVPLSVIEEESKTLSDGTSILGIIKALEKFHFQCKAVRCELKELCEEVTLPCIVQLLNDKGHYHFVVIHKIKNNKVLYADPVKGISKDTIETFEETFTGAVVITAPKSEFESVVFEKIGISEMLTTLIFPHKRLLIQIISLSFLLTFLGIVSSLFSKILMDEIIPFSLRSTLLLLVLFFGSIAIIQSGLSACRQQVLLYLSRKIDIPLLLGYYHHILHLPYTFFVQRKTGDIITRFQDAMTIKEIFTNLSVSLIMDVTLALITCVILWFLNSSLFLVLCIIVCMNMGLIYIFKKPYKEINVQQMEASSQLNSKLIESLTNIETLKATVTEQYQIENLEKRIVTSQKIGYKEGKIKNIQNTISSILNTIGNLVFMAIGATYIMDGTMSIGDLMVFQTLSQYFIEPVQSLVSLQLSFQEANIAMQRLNELMMIKKENDEGRTVLLSGDIVFKNVTFSYGYKKPILDHLNLVIPETKVIGIVGESGVGKSSFAKLIVKFLSLQKGSITIGDYDIQSINAHEVRKHIAYIPQHAQLFSGTIMDNLQLGNDSLSFEKVVLVCKQVGIHDFIEKLDHKYFSVIEEDGSNLSLGEKQRLTIARAILQDPPYYIFDEVTSNLDSISETYIHHLIFHQLKEKTRIIIAHRLTTIEQCDEIFVLDNSVVVEHGSHQDLLKKKGKYFEMVKLQNIREVI